MLSRWSSDRIVYANLVAAHFLLSGGWLVFRDLVANHSFLSGDSQDWIANGLFLAGHDVVYTARPPLLPLLLAGLSRLALLDLYPVLAQVLIHGTSVGLYALLRLDHSRTVAGVVAGAWLLDTTWLKLSLPVMADVPAACLLFWAFYFWRGSGFVKAGLCAGLAAVTQPLALLMVAPVILTCWIAGRPDVERWKLGLGALLFAAPTLVWWVAKKQLVGSLGDLSLRHWSLLRLHFDSVAFYAVALVALVGVPALVGILLGAVSLGRRARRRDPWALLVLTSLGTILTFFVFIYDFEAVRFLAHAFPLMAVLLAEGLQQVRGGHQKILCGLILVWAVLPAPGRVASPHWVALWPAPATFLVFGADEGQEESPLRIETRSLPEVARSHPYSLAWRAYHRPRLTRGFEPDTIEADWALYFYDELSQADDGYAVATRWGNLLYERVLYLPASAFGPAWSRLDFERLGVLEDRAVFRATIPGREGSWLVLLQEGGVPEKRVRRAIATPRNDSDDTNPQLQRAEEVAPHLAGRSVAVRAPDFGLEPWLTYLPLVASTTRFVVTEPERELATRALLGRGTLVADLGDHVLTEHRVYGQPWLVIEPSLRDPGPASVQDPSEGLD